MSDYFNAFEMSPVPVPGPDAVAPEPFRGIYGMPMFVTVPTADVGASVDFWTRALGFFELFSIPGGVVHLRRWAFQDVLLVPGESGAVGSGAAGLSVSFACVLGEIDALVEACRAVGAGSVEGPRDTPWNTRDVVVGTPEGVRVVFTAAKPFDSVGQVGRDLAAMGITPER
ncbi:VOC family protein [Streptomyces sp. NPDC048290]|uniref:VOC family protein n=1 Tax=Streptomyces sp. NPDC048290 TaxID=3155811 RepID=UPI003414099E